MFMEPRVRRGCDVSAPHRPAGSSRLRSTTVPAMEGSVTIQFLKYPQARHWRYTTSRLGIDDHGTWLYGREGDPAQRGDETPVSFESTFVMLVPHSRWWTLVYSPTSPHLSHYVDVCTQPCWVGDDHVEMIDLDLDVVRTADGRVLLWDEDEFTEHSVDLGYPPSLIASARTTAAELMLSLERGDEPFTLTAHTWFERILQP